MAWFRLGGAGISAALKNAMTAVLNKKLGTSQEYAPNAWPEEVNLLGALEEKTASGSIVTFSDGADDVPLKSCEVTIPPTLSGVSALTVENDGNLCDFDNYNVEANTNTTVSLGADLTLKKGTYTLAFNISDTVTATRNRPCYVVNGNYTYADNDYKTSGRYSWTFTLADDTTLSIKWWAHTVSANITISDFMLTHGSTAHDYEPYQTPTTYTANLGRTIYGGQADIVNGTGTDENGNDFTFTGQEIPTRLGYNAFWSDEGDTEVTYRSSGTITPVLPTLISKTITENGTYSAEDDNADGYDEVTVNVPPIRNVYASIASFSDSVTTIPLLSAKCIVTPTSNGISSVVFKHVGKNHVKKAKIVQGSFNTDGGDVDVATTRIRTDNYIPLAAGTYKIENKEGYEYVLYVYSSNDWQTFISAESLMSWQSYGSTFTLANDRYVRIGWRKSNNADILPSEIHDYILYDTSSLTQITATLGRTIYGGEIDVVNGTGTDEDGNDFTFTGQAISAYSGENNIYNAVGNTEIEYIRQEEV